MTSSQPDPVGTWQPATSEPGELYTPQGQINAIGAAARGLRARDPRNRAYRRSMMRSALMVLAAGIMLVAVVAVVASIL